VESHRPEPPQPAFGLDRRGSGKLMSARTSFWRVLAAGLLVAGLSESTAALIAVSTGNPMSGQVLSTAEMESVLFSRLNDERRERGLKILLRNPVLDEAARKHAADMAGRREVSHLSSNGKTLARRLEDLSVRFLTAGENAAFSETFDASFIHDQLMRSPDHRANILNPAYDRAGLGVVGDLASGYFVVEDLTEELVERPTDEARTEIRAAVDRIRAENKLLPIPPDELHEPFADALAAKKAAGLPLPEIPRSWGAVRILVLQTPVPDQIPASLENDLSERYDGLAVGVAFGSDPGHPGGAYTIILALLLPYQSSNHNVRELETILLERLNALRERANLPRLRIDPRLAVEARRLAGRVSMTETPTSEIRGSSPDLQVLGYLTEDPSRIPDVVEQSALGRVAEMGVGTTPYARREGDRRPVFGFVVIFRPSRR